MRKISVTAAVGFTLSLTATQASALGFGNLANATQLGQPLDVAADVQLGSGETLATECVTADVYSGDNRLPSGQLRVTLQAGADASQRSVRVTSQALIDEPVVTVNLTIGCASKMSRRFVVFVDPAPLDAVPAMVAALPRPVPPRAESPFAPLVAAAQGAASSDASTASHVLGQDGNSLATLPAAALPLGRAPRRPVRPAAPMVSRSPAPERMASVDGPVRPVRKPASNRTTNGAPPKDAPRLQLDAEPTLVARAPVAAASAASASASASSSSSAAASAPLVVALQDPVRDAAQAESLDRERRRIQKLEDDMVRLASESRAVQQALAGLQTRLKDAEAERYTNPLVGGLVTLSGVLGLALVGLWRRQSRSPRGGQWWASQADEAAEAAEADEAAEAAALAAPVKGERDPLTVPAQAALAESVLAPGETTAPHGVMMAARTEAETAPAAPTISPDTVALPELQTAVDELIDLEQQAEFFVVLGQDEAAIDLFAGHLRSATCVSPLPYLELLEIHRRRDDRAAHEQLRERFQRRFKTPAPDWDADVHGGRSVADYPDVAATLQRLWSRPADAMEALDAALFGRQGVQPSLDLPAHRELLFLYAVARDLAEHAAEDGGGVVVDLLLPLDVPAAVSSVTALRHSGESAPTPLDLDISAPAPLSAAVSPAPASPPKSLPTPALSVLEIDSNSAFLEFADVPSRSSDLAYQH